MDVRDKEGRGEGFVGVKKGFAVMTMGFAGATEIKTVENQGQRSVMRR